MKYTHRIQAKETGTKIADCLSEQDALELVEEYELEDRENETFTPNFYEVVELVHAD